MGKSGNRRITSCTVSWLAADNQRSVVTRVLPREIQVRHYDGQNLIGGRIWPVSEQQKQDLFDLLYRCLDDWYREDYAADVPAVPHWQFKICADGSCRKAASGTTEPPPHGKEIHEMIAKIIGEESCFLF